MVYAFIYRPSGGYAGLPRISLIGPEKTFTAAYLDPASVDPVSKIATSPMAEGYPVDPATVPKAILWESKRPHLPDLGKLHGIDLVSDRVRDLIEGFEPGVHQFLPVDFFRRKEKEPFARAYWLVVCRRIDSADPTHTTYSRHPRAKGLWEIVPGGKYVFSLTAIGRSHLWVDPCAYSQVFCSQALGDALAGAKVKDLWLEPYDAV
jgi:hypothetical protein